jgi:hypothetical protein
MDHIGPFGFFGPVIADICCIAKCAESYSGRGAEKQEDQYRRWYAAFYGCGISHTAKIEETIMMRCGRVMTVSSNSP